MKNEHQENGVLRGPLILMAPGSNLVAVLSLDWLDSTNQAAVSAKTHDRNYLANPPRTPVGCSELSRAAFSRAGRLTKAGGYEKLEKRQSEPLPS